MKQLNELEKSLRKKELEAIEAKNKGLTIVYANILLEINILKTKMKKFQMGRK